MKKFKLLNNVTGWVIFLIAAFTYLSTIEPTASFWDCGEFIATAFKLEVGHPPGAPLFMIMGRFVSLFASDPTKVPIMMNSMSALASAFTILFMFWSITYLALKLTKKTTDELNLGETIAILGSGVVGALAYTWSDTFWFSAVEAEVYASSSMFTALVFWAILKWDAIADQKYANRWIILIAYLIGLSIGVHLLNLLAIPAIVLVVYYRKFKPTRKKTIIALLLSFFILAFIMYFIIPYTVIIASWFELLFVNVFGLPYNSGVIFYIILLLSLIVYGLYYTHKKRKVIANTAILAFTAIIIGYSSFSIIVIRSIADPPLNENDPNNVFSLLSYLNREQYGDRPLFYGQTYNAPLDPENPYVEGSHTYVQENGKYVATKPKEEPNYDSRFKMLFPRMYSPQANHVRAYKSWGSVKGTPISVRNPDGTTKTIYKPTFGENLKYFFKYQIGHMYLRYFMWNFAGRQNDIQGHGSVLRGNWISGIPFIDDARLGPQENLPDSLKNNWASNKYYMLPLLLGLIGLFFQFKKDVNNFWVVMLLFLMTGLAIVIYLNQYPYQPRERDYAYAGSFYAFAIWIGLGVLALYDFLSKKLPKTVVAAGVTVVTLFAVPVVMAQQNWDDHDRSDRYTPRDFAYDYLNSCAKDAILFTNGDNDTFPLWYAQEVEGIRTDVRVVNLSLFNTDWYIDQTKKQAYNAAPVPITYKYEDYMQDIRNYVPVYSQFNDYKDIRLVDDFVKSNDNSTKLQAQSGEMMNYVPADKILIPVDKQKVLKNGTVPLKDSARIKDVKWDITKRYMLKGELMIMDMLANNDWNRPIYFAITVGQDSYLNLEKNFRLEGLAYRIVPVEAQNTDGQIGEINTDIMYNNLIKKFKWGGIEKPNVYIDENNMRMLMNFRNNFARLAKQFIREGKKDKAIEVLDKSLQVMPIKKVPLNVFAVGIIEAYYLAGDTAKANELAKNLDNNAEQELAFYFSLDKDAQNSLDNDKRKALVALQEVTRMANTYKQKDLFDKFNKALEIYYTKYQQNQ